MALPPICQCDDFGELVAESTLRMFAAQRPRRDINPCGVNPHSSLP